MKMCKNEFDIILYPVTQCYCCAFKRHMRPCLWFRMDGVKASLYCGGITKDTISDIFHL